jgi:hypothetical protein
MTIRNQVNATLENLIRDLNQIKASPDPDLSPEANAELQTVRQQRVVEHALDALQRAQRDAQSRVAMAGPRANRPGVDWKDTASITAGQTRWQQVVKLLDAGKPWEQVIEDADETMLAAINTFAPDHIEAQAIIDGTNPQPVVDKVMQASDQRAAALAGPGLSGMGYYMQQKADAAWVQTLVDQAGQYTNGDTGMWSIDTLVGMWRDKADYVAARELGVMTPNERAVRDHYDSMKSDRTA